jgi:ectoine hydroxylase
MVPTDFREMRNSGFQRLPGLVDGPELARLRAAVEAVRELAGGLTESTGDFVLEAAGVGGWVDWQQGGAAALPGVLRSASRIHQRVPYFAGLQRRLDLAGGVAGRAAGGPGVLANSFLWAKPARVGSEKPWHQDLAFAPPGFDTGTHSVMTVWIAVDPATEANGCLQFVPGSHRYGVLPHTGDPEREPDGAPLADPVEPHVDLARVLPDSRPVAVPLPPGSAVVFDGLVLHRSAPNSTAAQPRTAVSFVYRVPRPVWTQPAPAA